MHYKYNIEASYRKHFCFGKINKYYLFSVCARSLRYPASKAHAPCILPSVACLALLYFTTLCRKR